MLIIILFLLLIWSLIYEFKKNPKILLSCLVPTIIVISLITIISLKHGNYNAFMSFMFSTLMFNEAFIYLYLKLKDIETENSLWFDIFFWVSRLIEVVLVYFSIVTIVNLGTWFKIR